MPFEPTRASVLTEGCDLHYRYQGSGPLLVFSPGGGGIGRQFNPIFEHPDKHFTVCTYDRRQTNDSRVERPQLLNPAQQAPRHDFDLQGSGSRKKIYLWK